MTIDPEHSAIPRSLQPLALIALKEAGADGYALYQLDPETEVRQLKYAWGLSVPESVDAGLTVEWFPLRSGEPVTGTNGFKSVNCEVSIYHDSTSFNVQHNLGYWPKPAPNFIR